MFAGEVREREERGGLVVQDDAEERAVDFKTVGIVNEAEFLEFVHEEIHAGTRCADHFRQSFLRNFGKDLLRLIFLAIAGEQEQGASKALFGGVEKLVDQILFDADVSGEHVSDEAVGEFVLGVEDADHLVLIDHKDCRKCGTGGGAHSNGLTCDATFAKKVSGAETGDDSFFARGIDDGKLDAALLDVHDVFGGVALGKDGCFFGKLDNFSCQAGRVEEGLSVKSVLLWQLQGSPRC